MNGISQKQRDHIVNVGRRNKTHGYSHAREYSTWKSMIRRCRDASYDRYPDYGGRGISVCERWLCIDNFIADMGPRPIGTSLDRIDVDGNYEPSNCRWASQKQQTNNTRYNTRFTLNGRTQTVHEWAEELGISPRTLTTRKRSGWSDEQVLTTPVDKRLSRWKAGDAPRNGKARNNRGVAA